MRLRLKKILALLVFTHYAVVAQDFAQSIEKVDSLKRELANATDSIRVADLCFTIYADYTFGIRAETNDTPDYLLRALRIYETALEYGKLADVHNAFGGYYYNRGLFEKAQMHWVESGENYQKDNNLHGVAKSFNNLSQAYEDDDPLKLEFIKKAESLSKQIGDTVILGSAYNNLSRHYQFQQDYDKAEEYLITSIQLAEKIDKVTTQQVGYIDLGLLKEEQDLTNEAIAYFEKSLTFNAVRSTDPNIVSTYEALVRLYEQRGDYTRAFEFQKLLVNAKDTLFNQQVNERLFSLAADYEGQKQELTIAAQQTRIDLFEKENQLKNQWIFFLALIAVALFMTIYLWKSRQFSRNQEQSQKVFAQDLIRNVEGERKRISSELHDGVGQQLILLKNQAKTRGDDQIVETVGNTLEEVRAITRDMHPAILDRMGLKAALEEMIHKLDEHTDIFFSIDLADIDNLFEKGEELNIYRMVQEGLNNIVKHADATSTKLTIERLDNKMILVLQDNGKGFNIERGQKPSASLGLKTLQERATMLKAKLKIQSGNSGTKITLDNPR